MSNKIIGGWKKNKKIFPLVLIFLKFFWGERKVEEREKICLFELN
jgi:hypothetical protein